MFRCLSRRDGRGHLTPFFSTFDAKLNQIDPSSINGLQLWLKADALSGLASGSAVASWPDSSGNNRNVNQSTTGNQPIYIANLQNGLPAVRFNGSTTMLSNSLSTTMGTILVVAKYNAVTIPSYIGLFSPDPSSPAAYYSSGGSQWYSDGSIARRLNGVASNNTNPNVWNLYSGRIASPLTWLGSVVGNDRGLSNRYWLGDIGEILVYSSSLSDADLPQVEGYLKLKWGTP